MEGGWESMPHTYFHNACALSSLEGWTSDDMKRKEMIRSFDRSMDGWIWMDGIDQFMERQKKKKKLRADYE